MQNPNRNSTRNILTSMMALAMLFMLFHALSGALGGGQVKELTQSELMTEIADGKIAEMDVQIGSGVYNVKGKYKTGTTRSEQTNFVALFQGGSETATQFTSRVLGNDSTLKLLTETATQQGVKMKTLAESNMVLWANILPMLLLMGMMGFFLYNMFQSGAGGGGMRGAMNFGKSRSKDISKQKVKVRFSDVAGAEEEKQELVEVVEFLKDPKRFTKLGARIPAGVLLEGPPGTGKTLLAKAVAGEAGVPFFTMSGSEFVEMFVGVGASRVRDLFENAKKNAPAIIFIDEIDAVGRQRGAGLGGGHDEREQTLNQLLVEMDGFEGNEGVIVIAATNRSDVLDPALLRPGRFDRQILVGNPDVKGREQILQVHARNKKLETEVDLKVVAQQTPGFSGAELENLLNEAALVAARFDHKAITQADIAEAHDRVIAGPAKKDRVISEQQRRTVAYHEAGHTIIGMVLSDARVVHKVTIVPRGRAGGYAVMLPREDAYIVTRKELYDQMVGLLGGRAAEEIVFNTQSTGASNDFQQATKIARSMVTEYGMSDRLGPVQYEGNHTVFVGRDYGQKPAYSDQVAYEIDNEVRQLLNQAHEEAHRIINEHREQLNLIAEKLLEVETLEAAQIESLFKTGKMPEQVAKSEETDTPTSAESQDQEVAPSRVEEALEAGDRIIADDQVSSDHHQA
ncbi:MULTISPECIES: ATP-dependent zinc metalloprotease FtsH [Abiotrophia]|uniref:ATP-dependent zinc metalloprotease FtsH n=1 Tax=Abiotrophia TaxID=46123 RepID=UPI001CB184E1|nr:MULTISPECIES: ATP-dependent zinc metalloprotease FtsH [Abiotrophia]MBF0936311.1 ATP-dependent metallopeptidase FtsH/Yme1/Tma family protein [Abiotrophia sp.]